VEFLGLAPSAHSSKPVGRPRPSLLSAAGRSSVTIGLLVRILDNRQIAVLSKPRRGGIPELRWPSVKAPDAAGILEANETAIEDVIAGCRKC
jgi:hypothetical protein